MKGNHKHGDACHGKIDRLWRIWTNMKNRCSNRRNHRYHSYGKRGIRVCKEWRRNYLVFKEWALANGYTPKLIIDRIDNNGNYCPENCRWVTYKINNNNRRDNRRFDVEGINLTVAEISSKYKISNSTLWTRLGRGWPIEKAIQRPQFTFTSNRSK